MSLVLPHCKEHSFPRLTAAAGWIWILFPPRLINGELPVLTATAGAIYRLNLMVGGFISLLYQTRCWAGRGGGANSGCWHCFGSHLWSSRGELKQAWFTGGGGHALGFNFHFYRIMWWGNVLIDTRRAGKVSARSVVWGFRAILASIKYSVLIYKKIFYSTDII